jgi:hypothetical protein
MVSLTWTPDVAGDVEGLSMWAGQSVALARRIQPASGIVAELVRLGGSG